jgi:hypothetical protein
MFYVIAMFKFITKQQQILKMHYGYFVDRYSKGLILNTFQTHISLYWYKCGHRNVQSKRQVWMSIFHIINFKKKIHGHRGPGFVLIKN